jgi:hypothetical protein
MGIVKRNLDVEVFLDSACSEWRIMSDNEYNQVFLFFRQLVENQGSQLLKGNEAYDLLSSKNHELKCVFNVPGYKGVPLAPNANDCTYAYVLQDFSCINRAEMNRLELVVCNMTVSFCCVFNHEWQAHFPELWFGEHT